MEGRERAIEMREGRGTVRESPSGGEAAPAPGRGGGSAAAGGLPRRRVRGAVAAERRPEPGRRWSCGLSGQGRGRGRSWGAAAPVGESGRREGEGEGRGCRDRCQGGCRGVGVGGERVCWGMGREPQEPEPWGL